MVGLIKFRVNSHKNLNGKFGKLENVPKNGANYFMFIFLLNDLHQNGQDLESVLCEKRFVNCLSFHCI